MLLCAGFVSPVRDKCCWGMLALEDLCRNVARLPRANEPEDAVLATDESNGHHRCRATLRHEFPRPRIVPTRPHLMPAKIVAQTRAQVSLRRIAR